MDPFEKVLQLLDRMAVIVGQVITRVEQLEKRLRTLENVGNRYER